MCISYRDALREAGDCSTALLIHVLYACIQLHDICVACACVLVCVCVCVLCVVDRGSRIVYRGSRIENRISRIENRISRIENRVSRIENRLSILEDQGSRSDTEFCPHWLSIHISTTAHAHTHQCHLSHAINQLAIKVMYKHCHTLMRWQTMQLQLLLIPLPLPKLRPVWFKGYFNHAISILSLLFTMQILKFFLKQHYNCCILLHFR